MMTGEPHLTKASFAELLDHPPVTTVRNHKSRRRPPAADLALLVDPPHLRGISGRDQRREALAAHFADLHRLGHALEPIGAVGQPAQLLGTVEAHGATARYVEGATGQKRLAAARQRHQPRRDRLGQPFHLERLGAALDVLGPVLVQHDFAEMDPDTGLDLAAVILRQPPQRPVVAEGVEGGFEGALEEQQEAVGLVDLPPLVIGQEVPGETVVTPKKFRSGSVAELLHQPRAVDQVADQQRLQDRAVRRRISSRPRSSRHGFPFERIYRLLV